MSILEVQKLHRSFGGLQAVNDINFSVSENQIKAVIGPNGAGKTTLFNLISGALKQDSGSIMFQGDPIHNLAPYRIARKGISRTFQNIKLFSGMTVLENVMIGRHIQTNAGFLSCMFNFPVKIREERKTRQRSLELLDFLGIANCADLEATSLPFGKQRLVEFARALATEPRLILLDEPAAGLNIHETALIADLITKIREQGITVLIIEHDMSLVMEISDEIVVLNSGTKITEGKPLDIQRDERVITIYLGEEYAKDS